MLPRRRWLSRDATSGKSGVVGGRSGAVKQTHFPGGKAQQLDDHLDENSPRNGK